MGSATADANTTFAALEAAYSIEPSATCTVGISHYEADTHGVGG
jgi:hypothetical protein